jgi:hypothetical protein
VRYEYFGGWHRHYKEPFEVLTEAEARRRHHKGEAYCVVARGNGDGAEAFVEVTSDYFGVNFLDARSRVYLTYGFEDVGGERLFLRQALFSEFSNETDQPSGSVNYYFTEDGAVTIERMAALSRSGASTEKPVDGTGNWERRPDFGQWAGLLRKERILHGSDA